MFQCDDDDDDDSDIGIEYISALWVYVYISSAREILRRNTHYISHLSLARRGKSQRRLTWVLTRAERDREAVQNVCVYTFGLEV